MSTEERGLPHKIDLNDMLKTLEKIIDYLNMFHGVSGICLCYVVRKNLLPKPTADNLSSNYTTVDLKMIARAPIVVPGTTGDLDTLERDGPFNPSYLIDRVRAFKIPLS